MARPSTVAVFSRNAIPPGLATVVRRISRSPAIRAERRSTGRLRPVASGAPSEPDGLADLQPGPRPAGPVGAVDLAGRAGRPAAEAPAGHPIPPAAVDVVR